MGTVLEDDGDTFWEDLPRSAEVQNPWLQYHFSPVQAHASLRAK